MKGSLRERRAIKLIAFEQLFWVILTKLQNFSAQLQEFVDHIKSEFFYD